MRRHMVLSVSSTHMPSMRTTLGCLAIRMVVHSFSNASARSSVQSCSSLIAHTVADLL